MTDPTRAVFLSYASQDAGAARVICGALRSGGIEVWFDQSELRGGDAWDRQIRMQIHDCALFIPIISANSQVRLEGYFRREWRLAVDRTHDMADSRPFLVPVLIDDTLEPDAEVPEAFRAVQWTRLPAGETPPAFVERVARLLAPQPPQARAEIAAAAAAAPATAGRPRQPAPGRASRRPTPRIPLLIAAAAILGVGYFALDKFVLSKHSAASLPSAAATTAIPEQSIAVLPFVNMSSDKEQDYFSDGLTEQMIDLLGQVPDLRVPARTSSFYFKGKNETIAAMAQQLKVAHVLEGSVRKAGKRLRITAQLIRADNGYHLWSQTYDRANKDIFAVQDEIAQAVVSALKVKLVAGAQVASSRGTTNIEAYNQYLLGRQLYRRGNLEGFRHAVEAYRKAISLDPNYAAAYAGLALVEAWVAGYAGDTVGMERAGNDVNKAIALAPDDAIGYAVRSVIRSWLWEWAGAQVDIEKALSLDPRSSEVQTSYASLLLILGRLPEAIAAQKKATELDPLSSNAWWWLGWQYMTTGNYAAADVALGRAIDLEPTATYALELLTGLRLLQGKAQEALEVSRKLNFAAHQLPVIAMAEHSLGHVKASQQALDEMIAKHAQDSAYQIAEVYAWRGEKEKAFEWLERAYKQRDAGLSQIKGEPMLKSLHADPRFNALLRKMKLPE